MKSSRLPVILFRNPPYRLLRLVTTRLCFWTGITYRVSHCTIILDKSTRWCCETWNTRWDPYSLRLLVSRWGSLQSSRRGSCDARQFRRARWNGYSWSLDWILHLQTNYFFSVLANCFFLSFLSLSSLLFIHWDKSKINSNISHIINYLLREVEKMNNIR